MSGYGHTCRLHLGAACHERAGLVVDKRRQGGQVDRNQTDTDRSCINLRRRRRRGLNRDGTRDIEFAADVCVGIAANSRCDIEIRIADRPETQTGNVGPRVRGVGGVDIDGRGIDRRLARHISGSRTLDRCNRIDGQHTDGESECNTGPEHAWARLGPEHAVHGHVAARHQI